MKWFEKVIVIFIIISVAITEYHTYVSYKWSFTSKLIVDQWMNKDHVEEIPFLYWLYEIEPIVKDLVKNILFAIVASFRFKRIKNVLIVFIAYDLTQLYFYFWNRNSSLFPNTIVYMYMALAVLVFFIPTKKGAKLVKITDYDSVISK